MIRDIIVILILTIGPFALEYSNPNAVAWRMLVVTAMGGLYGFSLFHFKLRTVYGFAAIVLFVVILCLLVDVSKSFSPTYFNWAGGYFAGLVAGAWPAQRAAELRKKEEPPSGWRLNNQELATSSIVAEQALLALRSLDGAAQYFLCVTFGPSRLDIIGNHHSGVVVFCTPDSRVMKTWSVLIGPGSDKKTFELRAARDRVTLPTNNLVTANLAQEALTYFVAHQTPDPNQKWLTGSEAFYRRPPSTR